MHETNVGRHIPLSHVRETKPLVRHRKASPDPGESKRCASADLLTYSTEALNRALPRFAILIFFIACTVLDEYSAHPFWFTKVSWLKRAKPFGAHVF